MKYDDKYISGRFDTESMMQEFREIYEQIEEYKTSLQTTIDQDN